jgi:molybdopterin-guanine dinucleotide biosynthesis protein A
MPLSSLPDALPLNDITGCVLAGGRGMRMGGMDKGLQPFLGLPLAAHALRRLAPQVGHLLLNANRHAEAYAQLGAAHDAPVWPDAEPDYPGPLAFANANTQQELQALAQAAALPNRTPF